MGVLEIVTSTGKRTCVHIPDWAVQDLLGGARVDGCVVTPKNREGVPCSVLLELSVPPIGYGRFPRRARESKGCKRPRPRPMV